MMEGDVLLDTGDWQLAVLPDAELGIGADIPNVFVDLLVPLLVINTQISYK